MAIVFQDISQRREYEKKLIQLAEYDTLTGLANRYLCLNIMGQATARAARAGHSVALLFLDLDRFKQVNDTFTHLVGEAKKLMPLPNEADPLQLAMLTVNPPTAHLMLSEFVTLEPGEWVIQNAANSGVGEYLVQLAKIRGLKTVVTIGAEPTSCSCSRTATCRG